MWFPSNNDSSVVATIRLPLLAFIVLGLSNLHAATFNWNGSANDNWDNGSNWGGGNPGYPGRDRDTDTAELYGDFSNNSSRFTIDMNNGTNGRITKISNLYVTADSSSDNWDLIDTNGHSATIEISGKMAFDLDSSGTFNCEAYLTVSGSDLYVAADSGSRPVFERSISGSGILDATDGILVENKTLYGGTVAFTAAYNDSFTGRIKTGITKIETTSTEGFRNATIEISNNPNSFIFPNGAKIKALTGNYNLALEGKQLRVGYNNSGNFTYAGKLTGTGSIEKIGSGTWTLSGDSTHTGGTTVSGGTLNIDHNSLASNTALQINSGGTVNFDSVQNMTLSTLNGSGALIIADDGDLYLSSGGTFTGNISGDGGIVLNAGASLSLSGNNTFLAGIAIRNGALLVVDNASALGSESALLIFDGGALSATESTTIQQEFVALNTNGTGELNVDSGDEMTWAGPIEKWTEPFLSSTTTLIKSGAGTLAITRDANTFDGTVQVNAGQIAPSTNALAAATVDLRVQDAIRFDNAVTIAQLTGSQSLSLSNTLTLAGDADATFSGTLTGSGALFKEGTGTLTLDTDHSFTGNLLVNEGTLHLDGSLATTTLTCLNLALDNGTSLTGNANIAAPILSFGTAEISPGASIGTLQATRFQINGSYLCEIDGSQSDQLITTGELGLSVTSTLKLSFPSGGPTADAYVLASYGTISGTFGSVTGLPGSYYIDYAYNNGSSSNHVALVKDTIAPTITLNGADQITVGNGESFTDPGATASDNLDGSIAVTVGGDTVNTTVPGIYTLTYDATDSSGNAATQVTRTVTVLTVFKTWTADSGLSAGVNDAWTDDPDLDGKTNLVEFAHDGDPLSPSSDGKQRVSIYNYHGTDYFALTIPVRSGATFSGSPSLSATRDGITYTAKGSLDLTAFTHPVTLGSAEDDSGLPTLNPGWEYRSFWLETTTSSAFLQLQIEAE